MSLTLTAHSLRVIILQPSSGLDPGFPAGQMDCGQDPQAAGAQHPELRSHGFIPASEGRGRLGVPSVGPGVTADSGEEVPR